MKSKYLTILAVFLSVALGLQAQMQPIGPAVVPQVPSAPDTNATTTATTGDTGGITPATPADNWEITLSGGGITPVPRGQSEFGLDVSVETHPWNKIPNLWVGGEQALGWQPEIAGSSDVFSDYSWNVYKEVFYVNTGWSGGAVYDKLDPLHWRTGPEVSLELYTVGNAFILAQVNYDIGLDHGSPNGFRYSIGVGFTLDTWKSLEFWK